MTTNVSCQAPGFTRPNGRSSVDSLGPCPASHLPAIFQRRSRTGRWKKARSSDTIAAVHGLGGAIPELGLAGACSSARSAKLSSVLSMRLPRAPHGAISGVPTPSAVNSRRTRARPANGTLNGRAATFVSRSRISFSRRLCRELQHFPAVVVMKLSNQWIGPVTCTEERVDLC
ncbi:MAG: hypothetical protein JWO97_3876 [Acidobacteria bacterium]|nr:hypothetical protein [Acidobacteriota bacterium]